MEKKKIVIGWYAKEDIEDIAEFIFPRNKNDISATKMRKYLLNDEKELWQSNCNEKIYKYYDTLRKIIIEVEEK